MDYKYFILIWFIGAVIWFVARIDKLHFHEAIASAVFWFAIVPIVAWKQIVKEINKGV